jgi:hypothetical protein
VPVTTAGLADVGAADPQPAVVPRRLDQGVQQPAVGGLDGGPRGEGGGGLSCTLGKLVAHALEGAEIEHPRAGRRGGDPMGDVEAAEALEGQARQLELEAADLAAQLGAGEELGVGMRAGLGASASELVGGWGRRASHLIVWSSGLVASRVWVKT